MDKNGNMTRREACYFLGIRENSSEEQIKRAYRYKAKLYHPDANPSAEARDYYLKVQKAYECLMSKPCPDVAGRKTDIHAQAGKAAAPKPDMRSNFAYGYPPYGGGQINQPFSQNAAKPHPAKVFASTPATRASYERQKEQEKERKRIQKWDKENKSARGKQQASPYGQEYADDSRSEEEKALEKIRAIWLAETIRRQIELDQEHKEALQRRKLYKAFMQHEAGEEDSQD